MASSTSRMDVWRGRPPWDWGIRGWTKAHCSSLRSLGYGEVRIPHFMHVTPPYRTDSECLNVCGSLELAAVPQLTIRRMTHRWGSCTAEGRLVLNLDLILAPMTCIDYVITHE